MSIGDPSKSHQGGSGALKNLIICGQIAQKVLPTDLNKAILNDLLPIVIKIAYN